MNDSPCQFSRLRQKVLTHGSKTEFQGKGGIIYDQRHTRSRQRAISSVAALITPSEITPPVGVGTERNTKKAKRSVNTESTRPNEKNPSCAKTTETSTDNTTHVHPPKRFYSGPLAFIAPRRITPPAHPQKRTHPRPLAFIAPRKTTPPVGLGKSKKANHKQPRS